MVDHLRLPSSAAEVLCFTHRQPVSHSAVLLMPVSHDASVLWKSEALNASYANL